MHTSSSGNKAAQLILKGNCNREQHPSFLIHNALTDQRGGAARDGLPPPSRSNLFHFHAVSDKRSCQIIDGCPSSGVGAPIWEISE